MANYIDVPLLTSFNEIVQKDFSLSASQYKTFCSKNKTLVPVSSFLSKPLTKNDLGVEIGSNYYVEQSGYYFIKTKALQPDSYLLSINKDSVQQMSPKIYKKMDLKKGDLLISKDGNVGEIAILDKDYPNTMICGGIYRLPVKTNKYYLLAFIKSNVFRQQIDFLVPKGATIKHGKTKFLNCMIPIPNHNSENTIKYVEVLMQAIINKEIEIKRKHALILNNIKKELEENQTDKHFVYSLPTINEVLNLDRMDSSLYSANFKENEFLIKNYIHGTSTIEELGFEKPSRGQNLQVSNIGKSIYSSKHRDGYYTLVLPKHLTKYGTASTTEYLGNSNNLKVLKQGEIIFGAEGNEKGRSMVVIEEQANTITNIHGITLTQKHPNIQKSVFVKLFLDYYRNNGMVDAYAVGGNGGSLAIKYWHLLRFPNFPDNIERKITQLYHNSDAIYDTSNCSLDNLLIYDSAFNTIAGIHELDKSKHYLEEKLQQSIEDIVNDVRVEITF